MAAAKPVLMIIRPAALLAAGAEASSPSQLVGSWALQAVYLVIREAKSACEPEASAALAQCLPVVVVAASLAQSSLSVKSRRIIECIPLTFPSLLRLLRVRGFPSPNCTWRNTVVTTIRVHDVLQVRHRSSSLYD